MSPRPGGEDDFGFDDFSERLEVLVFEVGDEVYAADAALVTHIDRPGEDTVTRTELGPLRKGNRAICFSGIGGSGSLRVDAVRGVVQVMQESLRRLPLPAVAKESCAMGVWLDGEKPVLLVDLLAATKT